MKRIVERSFFAVALLVVAAVSVWWTIFLARTIRLEYRLSRSELMHNAMVTALLLGQKKEKPAPGPLPGSMPLEVVVLDERTATQPAAAALPFHPDRAVRPRPEAVRQTEERYQRRRWMLAGEGVLLAMLLILLGVLYFHAPSRKASAAPLFQPIGRIRTPYSPQSPPPLPLSENEPEARLEVAPAFADGLFELETFRYLYVLYCLDRPEKPWRLRVHPPRAGGREVGLFASRSPHRPFPVGLAVVRLKRIEGHTLITSAIDAFDGTPLLDIKPYFKSGDAREDANDGWREQEAKSTRPREDQTD